MAIVLFAIASALAALGSLAIFTSAKSAIHEILGVALGLVSSIFSVGSVVTWYLYMLPERIALAMTREQQRNIAPTAGEALRERLELEVDRSTSLSLKIIVVVLCLFGAAVFYALTRP